MKNQTDQERGGWAALARPARIAGIALALAAAAAGDSRADGVAQVLSNKTLPAATVALIDPESGTSSGGGTTDVKVSVGDVISFRFKYFPVPDKIVRGLQGYLTEYIPPNTEVVGVRIVDENGLTILPRYPGISVDGCAGNCPSFAGLPSASGPRSLPSGSIAQIYADTGVFYATSSALGRNPAASFLSLQNGTVMNPEPRNIGAIISLLGAASPVYAHNAWDWTQVRAYGISNSGGNASNNGGRGVTPFLYGSPVAGPLTFYRYEASEPTPGTIQFNDSDGPWQRIRYPGAQIGSGAAASGDGSLLRVNRDTALGFDLTPANPLPAGTRAVRFALGEVRVGEPGFAEIALRVKGTPLDPTQNQDVDCAEVTGGDTSAASDSVRARDNPWPNYLASPACAFLNLLFDLEVDRPLARTGETLTYTLTGKNLSRNTQNQASVRLKFDANDVAYVAGSGSAGPGGAPTLITNCDGDSKQCLVWPASDLQPSDEYKLSARFTVGGGGHVTNVMFANYRSTQLPAPGFTTQSLTIIKEVAVVKAALAGISSTAAGGVASLSGTLSNPGTGSASLSSLTLVLPSGWQASGPVLLGGTTINCTSGCTGNRPVYTAAMALAPGGSLALSFGAAVPSGAAAGLHDVDLQVWASQSMFGGGFETYFPRAAQVPVGASRSTPPDVRCPIGSGSTRVEGTTSEPDGTTVRVYLNGLPRGMATSAGGTWTVTDLSSFGALYGGVEVRATATAAGELESELGPPCFGSVTPVCSDGIDNDSDGATDFPADLGCTSPLDGEELDAVTPPPVGTGPCADGIDNDGNGTRDFPADPGCHSAFDAEEQPVAAPSDDTRGRILIAFDTSGSMNWNTCSDTFTGGDGSDECPGTDLACLQCQSGGCGDAVANDSRLAKVKAGISDVLRAFGEVDFGLMRFHQRPESFGCPSVNASLGSGGWQGAGTAPCGGGFNAGDLLVSFSPDNRTELLAWMDGEANYSGTPPAGLDHELRGSGTTPLGGILQSALTQIGAARGQDPRQACRPYRVVLVTDGAETCGGNPVAAAAALRAAGVEVNVIGFATTDATIAASLDAIASAGGTGRAVVVEDAAALSAAMVGIIADSILVETCNGADDDCDGLTDEDFPDKGDACSNGQAGLCARDGTRVCTADGQGTRCDAPAGAPGAESCPNNGTDDDCNGVVDDVPGGCPMCTPEVCNAVDDDCDGAVDEEADLFPCLGGTGGACPPACGGTVGQCRPGTSRCVAGALVCEGGAGPVAETCDGLDNDCNTVIDGFSRGCYPAPALGCDPGSGTCQGICRLGASTCPRLDSPAMGNAFGECVGAITPQLEVCNGLDDDCNGTADDVAGGCDRVCIPRPEICNGVDDDCDGVADDQVAGDGDACVEGFDPVKAGMGVCRAGTKRCVAGSFRCEGEVGPSAEICDGKDNDCDGEADGSAPCPSTFACAMGACQPICSNEEFACAADRACLDTTTLSPCSRADRIGCSCLPNPCVQAGCDPARAVCRIEQGNARCVDRCQDVACPGGTICLPASGSCADCHSFGCKAGELCLGSPGACQSDPCEGKSCAANEYCSLGQCIARCSTACGANQQCLAGRCMATTCPMTCSAGQVCNPETETCQKDLCTTGCARGQVCVPKTGACSSDPCASTRCGLCSVCALAFDGSPFCAPDQSCRSAGRVRAGPGCACALGSTGREERGPAGGGAALALLLALLGRRRRRTSLGSGGVR